ncbi:uncharacterized protein LOC116774898 [Danaus plexippus]|uniref:uncharacterized protein LOC116774898 n=1 Tax=Danaus plexippus TaxID=13037 RepID=UPI002AAF3235|nr:uncharacterized protein LOC116774898 [Danaus plexippus]XP_061380122.1 uncharacterized protein LOC116774898 [Danaus plexippus]
MARRHTNGCVYARSFWTKTLTVHNIGVVILVLASIVVTNCHNETRKDVKGIEDEIPKKLKIIEAVAGRGFLGDVYQNGTFNTGNGLWDNILNKCTTKPTVSCLQKNFYSYLDESLDINGDINVSSGVCFKKNNVDMNKYSKEANIIYLTGSKDYDERSFDEENEINDDDSETPLEEVTDALYGKGVKFLMTHDMKIALPELMFDGATLKVSPRALTKTGALVHIDLEPRHSNGDGRIFINKIKKYVKKKLVMAALAIILVIKLIALKLVFVLPVILGVTTAKKMFLKVLLFLFPALSHIFKLCSWYHQNYHTTKYHHHHHLITHHHKVPHGPPAHVYGPPHGAVIVKPHETHSPSFEHYPQDWELSGPGLGSEYLSDIHRNAIASFKPNENDVNDINAWGLGLPANSLNIGEYASPSNAIQNSVPHPNSGQKNVIGPGRPAGPLQINPYYRNKKTSQRDPSQAEKEALIRAAALASKAPASPVRDELIRVSTAKLTESNRVKAETELVKQQQEILAAQDPETIAAEKFYGTLIDRINIILNSIGAKDFGCRERAICALYSDPFKHAPYSNLVSNELSKDSNELVPPADSKMALHYFRYVQAARDGQESKNCLDIYAKCNIDYNKK